MRKWKGTPEQISYRGMATRRVKKAGAICYEDQRVFISHALAGWDLGLRYRSEQLLEVYFVAYLFFAPPIPTFSACPTASG